MQKRQSARSLDPRRHVVTHCVFRESFFALLDQNDIPEDSYGQGGIDIGFSINSVLHSPGTRSGNLTDAWL